MGMPAEMEKVMSSRCRSALAMACLAICLANEGAATALIGGVMGAIAGSGACNDTHSVPNNTAQDTFTLSSGTACAGGSASGAIRGDAASASVGLLATSSGNGFGSSSVAGQVAFSDRWLLTVPAGTAPGFINIPVSLTLEGSISPGAVDDATFGRFLDYNLSISDYYAALTPGSNFAAYGQLTASGDYAQTFNGSVNFYYYGPNSLPTTAVVAMSLFLPALYEGTVDFYNTASISMTLPPGFSAATSSGLPLVFAGGPGGPTLSSAASRKVHGASGAIDLPLALTPTNPTTEPRSGPAHTIVFTFDKAVTGGTAAVSEGTATAGAPTFSGNAMIVPITGVANEQYATMVVTDVVAADGGTGGTGSVRVGFLTGDVNGNRSVTLSDLLTVNAALTQPVTGATYLRDVNVTGTLSLSDILLVNANLTRSLPVPSLQAQ